MKTSTDRILTTQVGSIPRPESVKELLRARLEGTHIDEGQLAERVQEAVADVVRRQNQAGIDIVSDGEMSKTSFVLYTDQRLTGFSQVVMGDTSMPASNQAGPWVRRI